MSNPDGNKNELGFIEEEILRDETFKDNNPLSARKNAFNWYMNFQDIFNDASNENVKNIVGIEDILSILHKIEPNSTAVTLELWFNNEEVDMALPYVNRILYGNTTTKIEQIENLAKELDYYKRKGLIYGKSKIISINQIGKFEIIADTPAIDPKLYQFFTPTK